MNATRRSIETILRKLDFDDLLHWAGEKIGNRGKSYVKHVDQLARTEDNALVAWVTGTERYATSSLKSPAKSDRTEGFWGLPKTRLN
jgi:uncharacterized Zn finger protein